MRSEFISIFLPSEGIADASVSRPNFEKVIYTKLLRFREDQLENYQGPTIEYSTSDYHHAPPRLMRLSSTRVSLQDLGSGGSHRRVSQYSILDECNKRKTLANQRKPSLAETEQSYDPFRPSRNQITKTQADRARITVLRRLSEFQKQRQPHASVTGHTASKFSVRNSALTRAQQADAYSVASSSPQVPVPRISRINTRITERHISPCSSRRSVSYKVPVRTSMSYKRGVSFAHMRRLSISANHLHSVARKVSPLTPQARYFRDGPERSAFSPETPSVADSPENLPPPIRMHKSTEGSGEGPSARQGWKEDTRNVSSELEQVCDEAFNRTSMASTMVTAAPTEPDQNYDSPATSLGVLGDWQISNGTYHAARRKNKRDSYLNRPLPIPPSVEHLESYTYRELAKTRALLQERAADTSMVMGPGYFDEVIAHLDRLMQPSTLRVNEQDRRAVSTPDQQARHPSKDEFELLLAKGPYGLQSVSEPISKEHEKDKATVRIVDEKPISPTKPLTIRKRSADSDRRQGAREQAYGGGDTRYYERPQGADRRIVGLSLLLDNALEPIEEDEDKENRDPRHSKTISAEGKKRGWFRRHEPAQRSQDSGRGPPPPPKNEPLLQYHEEVSAKDKATNWASGTPSDEIRVSETKKISTAKGRFFKIFSKRENKESKSRASAGKFPSQVMTAMGKEVSDNILWSVGYDLNDATSITNSTTSSHIHHAYMTGALQNLSTSSVARGRRTSIRTQKRVKSAPEPPRAIQPQHQNWLARFLRIKPTVSTVCFRISKIKARKEIARVFREWRKYGIRDIVVDRGAGRIWATVAERNCETLHPPQLFPFASHKDEPANPLRPNPALNIKPVSLAVEIFTILHHGRTVNLSVARFTQERGAKSSFNRVMEALESVLMARGFLVEEGTRREDMAKVLDGV